MQLQQDIVKHNEKYSIYNGIASSIPQAIASSYFALFAITYLNASDYQVGLISSLPQIAGVIAVIPAAIIVNKTSSKKRLTSYSLFFTRIILLFIAFVTLLPSTIGAWLFIILVALMNFPGTFWSVSWQAFIAELIPGNHRNEFFAMRNRMLTISSLVFTLIAGISLKLAADFGAKTYEVIFVIGFLFGMIELFFLRKHHEVPGEVKQQQCISVFAKELYQHKPYLAFLICGLVFNFAWQMAWPLFNIYQAKYCGADGFWFSIFVVCNQTTQIFSYRMWVKLCNKYSIILLLVVSSLGMSLATGLIILSTSLYWLAFLNVLTGFFVAGTMLLLFNGLLYVSKEEKRTTFVANYNFQLAFISFIAPLTGAFLLDKLNMNFAMLISTALRIFSGVLFLWMFFFLKKSLQEKAE